MCFAELIRRFPGQCRGVANAVANGRLGHSFMVVSDVEAHRDSFASFLATLWCCDFPRPDGMPCGECSTCRALASGVYGERLDLRPVGKMRQIPVGDSTNPEPDSLRYFGEKLQLSGAAGRKVGIIHDADRLNVQSQNALLKTLEEPPAGSMLVLLTAAPRMLLPTTRSRCQTVALLENRCRFDFPGVGELFAALRELWFSPERGLALGARAAGKMCGLAGKLKESAATAVEAEFFPVIKQAREQEMSAAGIKELERRADSAAAARYLKHRKAFFEAVYTFAAQVVMLASGAEMRDLPNPEAFENVELPPRLSVERGCVFLDLAEGLLNDLDYMVDEELSIRCFALEVALKPASGM